MYIPDDWIKDQNNEKEIRNLLSEYGGCVQFEGDAERIESRLRELGEHKILEKLKKGAFIV